MRAEKSVGSASASSSELVCSDCVPPEGRRHRLDGQVRTTLLKGSCSVRLHPEVWQWVRSASDFGFFGSKRFHDLGPEHACRAHLGHFHEEVHADGEEEGQARREGVDVEAALRRPCARTRVPSASVKASSSIRRRTRLPACGSRRSRSS
jgi:hypothetical protein